MEKAMETTYMDRLREHPNFTNISQSEITAGERIAKTVKDGDRPEDYLTEEQLYQLCAFYELQAIITQDKLLQENEGDDYDFGDDIDDDLENENEDLNDFLAGKGLTDEVRKIS